MPEIGVTQLDIAGQSEQVQEPTKRAVGAPDVILFILCCIGLLLYLVESESVRYLIFHLGLRR